MAIGISVAGDGGQIQIDQLYKNLAVASSGTATTNNTIVSAVGWTVTVSISSATSPIIAIASADYASVLQLAVSGSTYTWTITVTGYSAKTFSYWIFDAPSTSAASMGMRVWDASSNLVFDSGQKYMRIAGGQTPTSAGSATYTSGRTYAVVTCSPGAIYDTYYEPSLPGDVTQLYMPEYKISSNVVYWQSELFTQYPGYTTPSTDYGKILVIDVTNY